MLESAKPTRTSHSTDSITLLCSLPLFFVSLECLNVFCQRRAEKMLCVVCTAAAAAARNSECCIIQAQYSLRHSGTTTYSRLPV